MLDTPPRRAGLIGTVRALNAFDGEDPVDAHTVAYDVGADGPYSFHPQTLLSSRLERVETIADLRPRLGQAARSAL